MPPKWQAELYANHLECLKRRLEWSSPQCPRSRIFPHCTPQACGQFNAPSDRQQVPVPTSDPFPAWHLAQGHPTDKDRLPDSNRGLGETTRQSQPGWRIGPAHCKFNEPRSGDRELAACEIKLLVRRRGFVVPSISARHGDRATVAPTLQGWSRTRSFGAEIFLSQTQGIHSTPQATKKSGPFADPLAWVREAVSATQWQPHELPGFGTQVRPEPRHDQEDLQYPTPLQRDASYYRTALCGTGSEPYGTPRLAPRLSATCSRYRHEPPWQPNIGRRDWLSALGTTMFPACPRLNSRWTLLWWSALAWLGVPESRRRARGGSSRTNAPDERQFKIPGGPVLSIRRPAWKNVSASVSGNAWIPTNGVLVVDSAIVSSHAELEWAKIQSSPSRAERLTIRPCELLSAYATRSMCLRMNCWAGACKRSVMFRPVWRGLDEPTHRTVGRLRIGWRSWRDAPFAKLRPPSRQVRLLLLPAKWLSRERSKRASTSSLEVLLGGSWIPSVIPDNSFRNHASWSQPSLECNRESHCTSGPAMAAACAHSCSEGPLHGRNHSGCPSRMGRRRSDNSGHASASIGRLPV